MKSTMNKYLTLKFRVRNIILHIKEGNLQTNRGKLNLTPTICKRSVSYI